MCIKLFFHSPPIFIFTCKLILSGCVQVCNELCSIGLEEALCETNTSRFQDHSCLVKWFEGNVVLAWDSHPPGLSVVLSQLEVLLAF
jgi:hypothetical protein